MYPVPRGQAGGQARRARLSPQRRTEIARAAWLASCAAAVRDRAVDLTLAQLDACIAALDARAGDLSGEQRSRLARLASRHGDEGAA